MVVVEVVEVIVVVGNNGGSRSCRISSSCCDGSNSSIWKQDKATKQHNSRVRNFEIEIEIE